MPLMPSELPDEDLMLAYAAGDAAAFDALYARHEAVQRGLVARIEHVESSGIAARVGEHQVLVRQVTGHQGHSHPTLYAARRVPGLTTVTKSDPAADVAPCNTDRQQEWSP